MLYKINEGIVKYNAETILENVNIEIKDGEKIADSILYFDNNRPVCFKGSYEEYEEMR